MTAKTFTPADFIDLAGGDPRVSQMLANQANYMQNPPVERDPLVHPAWGSGPRVVDPFEVKR